MRFLNRFGNTWSALSLLCVAAGAALLCSSQAQAITIYWDGSSNPGAWGTAANWSTASGATTPDPGAAPGANDIAQFNISTVNTPQTINLNAAQSAQGLIFSSTGAVLLQGGGAANQTLTLGASGIVVNSGAGLVTIGSATVNQNVGIILGTDNNPASFNFTNNSGFALTLANKISSFGTSGIKTLTFDGTGNFTIPNTGAGIGSGANNAIAVVMNSTGMLQIGINGTSNTYTGGTTLNSGTIQVISTSNLPNGSALNFADGTTFTGVNPPGKAWTGMTQQWNGDFRHTGTAVSFAGGTVNLGATGTDATRTVSTVGGAVSIGAVISNGTNGLTNSLSVVGSLTLSGNNLYTGATTVTNGTLTLSGNNAYVGPTTVKNGTLSITGTNPSTGTTTLNSSTLNLSGNGTLSAPTAYAFTGNSNLTLTNTTTPQGSLVRVSASAPIAIMGNATITNTNTVGITAAETLGSVTLTGQLNAVLTNNMTSGSQLLTLNSLTRATPTSSVTFSAGGTGPNATSNQIVVGGGGTTTAGQIVGPWATVGTTAALQTDYAVYNSDVVGAAGIANSAETNWTGGATGNYTSTSTANTLTGDRTMNSWRYSAAAGALTLGANNFDTSGILNGGTGLLTISAAGGAVRQQGTAPSNLFINTGSSNITISAPIQNNTGALTLVKTGNGTLTLNTVNSSTGGVVFNAGNLVLGNTTSLGTGVLTFNGGSIGNTGTNTPVLNNNAMIWNGDVNYQSGITGGLNLGTGAITLNNIVKVSNATGLGFVIGGSISGSGGLIITGRSTWSGSGTFTGNTIITAGANAIVSNLLLQNSALDTAGNSVPAFSGTTPTLGGFLGANPFSVPANVTSLTLNLGTGANHKYSAALGGGTTMAVTKNGLGTQIFAGENTYTGATNINAGTLSIKTIQDAGSTRPNALGIPTIGNSTIGLADNATLQYTGFMSGSSNRVINLSTASGGTFTLDASGSTPFELSGGITTAGTSGISTLALTGTGAGSQSGSIVDGTGANITALTKSGAGTWTLGGVNTYSGDTDISDGILALSHASSNNIANTPTVTVGGGAVLDVTDLSGGAGLILGSGQTLRGSGTIVGDIVINGFHKPGNSPGIETFMGNYTLNGDLEIEILGATAGPTGYDQVLVTYDDPPLDYDITLGALSTLTPQFSGGGWSTDSDMLWIMLNETNGLLTGEFSNYAGSGTFVANFDTRNWLIYYNANFDTQQLFGGNDVVFVVQQDAPAVPEPGTFALAALGLLGLGILPLRRNRFRFRS